MKKIISITFAVCLGIISVAQPTKRHTTSPTNNSVNRTMDNIPAVTDKPGTTNSQRELVLPSSYSGIYTNTGKIGGITVTKTFNLQNSINDRFEKVRPGGNNKVLKEDSKGLIDVPRKNTREYQNEEKGSCFEEERRISLNDQGYLTLDIASQITRVYPGKAFHFENYNNASWNDIQESRKPFRISCSEPNIIGNVTEEVNDAREGTIRQAVANIYGRFPTDPSKVANLTFSMFAQEVTNLADLSVRIGAGGNGFGFSASDLFSFSEKTNRKTFFVDITKTLFTIDVEHPVGGLFTDPAMDTRDVIYMASVTYGIRILASIELNITDRAIQNSFNAKYDGLLYGGYIDADVFARDVNNQATAKLYVVGGLSSTVTSAFNIAELQQRINAMTQSVNYHTCKPIRYSFRNNDGEVVGFQSATDYFKYRSCDPPGENNLPATVTVRINDISFAHVNQEEDDVDLYGKIWANAYTANNKLLPPVGLQYDVFNRSQQLHLKKEDLRNSGYGSSLGQTVTFNFAAGEANNAILYIYFNLTDYDYGSGDDAIVMPDLQKYLFKNPDGNTYQFYGLKINLNDIRKGETNISRPVNVNCVDYEGDYPFIISITITKK